MTNSPDSWDHEYDVVVVGSGNGALTAAVVAHDGGARVLVIEKADKYGGTSASSGGGVWVPNNRYAKAAGADDSPEDARAYLESVSPEGKISPELLDTYAEQAPKMIDYLHENTNWVRYETLEHYPDYFPENPGGKVGHRSMEPTPVHGSELGVDFADLGEQHPATAMPGGVNFTQVEGMFILTALPGWIKLSMKLVFGYLLDFPTRLRTMRDARLTMGSAGIARLRLSLQDRGVSVWLNTPLTKLVEVDGRVVGVEASKEGKRIRISAAKGVILATGGFERNQELREKYLPQPTDTSWTSGNLYNTGDALVMAQGLGAATHQMDWGWWFTMAIIPGRNKAHMSQVEKGLPGSMTVNKDGKRFSNESQNYVTFVEDQLREYAAGNPCIPAYMIFDADFRYKRPVVGALVQSRLMPDWMVPKSWWTPSFLTRADSIKELAEKVGIDPDGLEATQKQFNEYAKSGKDLDYQRGDSSYDRYYADPEYTPNPCLGEIGKAPYYCIALYPGEMGTAGGLVIDCDGRVQNEQNESIPGLYACGNLTSALLPSYPGPGSTLGPAMCFGYLAARHATDFSDT
ncbi:MAG: 3-oxosteroid 1-dehydrogenase [Halieaceae bacterium]|jgi:3-oxosteroid 1-dehydrogenase